MGEAKHTSEVDAALRELVKQRDGMLRDPAISPARLAILHDIRARQFPLEAALQEARAQRDELLSQHQLQIPPSVERSLQRQLRLSEPTDEPGRASSSVNLRTRASGWLRFMRWPAPAAAMAVCLVISAGIIHFGKWESTSGDSTEKRTQASVENRPKVDSGAIRDRSSVRPERLLAGELGPDQIDSITSHVQRGPVTREQFGLRIGTAELASLQASFLATGRVVRDGAEESADMRLDLPVRAILIDDGIARTP